MTAVLPPVPGLSAPSPALDVDRLSRRGSGLFAALLSGALPPEPQVPHPPVPDRIEMELKPRPRAKLGLWPTQPARFSPPQRNDHTTSSAPAAPDDGPSGVPQQLQNAPDLSSYEPEPAILGKRLGQPGAPVFDAPGFDAGPLTPTATNAPEGFALDAPTPPPSFRRRAEPLPLGLDGLDGPSDRTSEPEPTMWSDPFEVAPDAEGFGADLDASPEGEAIDRWEDLFVSRTEERGVRVEFDMDLAVEVKAAQGEVDVHVEGTWEALHELGDLEFDLEQALADGGEHSLGRYTTRHRDPTARPQVGANRADPQDTPVVSQRRYAPGGRLYNGVA